MYKPVKWRRVRVKIRVRLIAAATAALFVILLTVCIVGSVFADTDEINECLQEEFIDCFDSISAKAIAGLDADSCPDAAELAELKKSILGEIKSQLNRPKLMFIEPEKANLFHIAFPVIINPDVNISGYFKQELKDPEGNIGLYTISFIAVAHVDRDDADFVCEAECLVFQQIVKGGSPYFISQDLLK